MYMQNYAKGNHQGSQSEAALNGIRKPHLVLMESTFEDIYSQAYFRKVDKATQQRYEKAFDVLDGGKKGFQITREDTSFRYPSRVLARCVNPRFPC